MPGDGRVPPELVREHLEHVLASPQFRLSESLRQFLRYTVEAVLAGKGDDLKEYTIGVEALGRPPSFDPRQDTIVRVQGRKLRERLTAYYSSAGASQVCRIDYRAGSYAPAFSTADETRTTSSQTVAVLPFQNLSANHSAGYFCDGLSEELIDLLARTPGLRVIGRTSSFQFKGRQIDIREIARQLGADLIIEGAVRNEGEAYRITVRLLSCSNGCEIWAGRYDRTLHDVLQLETEIAAAISSSLKLSAPPGLEGDSETITLYLKARHAWNRRTDTGFHEAIQLYTAATRHNPGFAKAWAGLAECYVLTMMHGLGSPAECMAKAREATSNALALDGRLAPARSALAAVLASYNRDFHAAQQQWQIALQEDPDYATAHHWYAMFGLVPTGKLNEAIDKIRKAEQLDPLSPAIGNDVGFVLYWSRRFDEAIDQCLKVIVLHPGFYRAYALLARIHAAQGRYTDAIAGCLKAREMSGGVAFLPFLLGTLGFAYAFAGDFRAARSVLEELHLLAESNVATAHESALIQSALGEWEAAAASIRTAFEQRTGWVVFTPVDSLFDPLREQHLVDELISCSRERSPAAHASSLAV